jgi:hypothetical protein
MRQQQRLGPRAEYQQQEGLRVRNSASLAATFQELKSLTVDFAFFDAEGTAKSNPIKYDVNLTGAKSVFRLNCPNDECVRGDFDLTTKLAEAIAQRRTNVTGELACQGWRSRTTLDTVRCENRLRYKLSLQY